MESWFSRGVTCQEAKQYIGNFLSVHRMRPRDDDSEDDGNSQDIVSDQELEISRSTLHDALATRVGGRETSRGVDNAEGLTHFENSTSAMELNQSIWESHLDNKNAQIPTFVENGFERYFR